MTDFVTVDDVVTAARAAIRGNTASLAQGQCNVDQFNGARAGILSVLLLLGIDVEWSDGTLWHLNAEDQTVTETPVPAQKPEPVIDPRALPPTLGRERLN